MNYLVLHPEDIHAAPDDQPALVASLHALQLIAEPLQHQTGYLTGDGFLQLITFLGCMPYVELQETQDDKEFCFVRFTQITPQATLLTGRNTARPRCPQCHAALIHWQPFAQTWPDSRPCPKCDANIAADQIRWRENAGLGRFFIKIAGIHPSEAVPSDALLNHLQLTTGLSWRWFYVQ